MIITCDTTNDLRASELELIPTWPQILPVNNIPPCFPFDLVIHSRVSGVQDISLLPHCWIFHCRFFSFLYKSNHCLARTIHFTIPTLKVLQNLQKQLHEWLTSYTASIIVVFFLTNISTCVYIYCTLYSVVYICAYCFLFFVYNYIDGVREKTSCKNVERVNPPEVWGSWDEYWRVLNKSRVLLNSVNLFVRMIIKFSYTAPSVSKDLCTCYAREASADNQHPFCATLYYETFAKVLLSRYLNKKGTLTPAIGHIKDFTQVFQAYLTL